MKRKAKHIYIILILLSFLAPAAYSQYFIDEHFGFFGGVTISNFTGDETIGERDARSGINIGGYYRYNLNRQENFALMPELMVVSKGGIYYTPQYGYAEFILRYLEVPLFILIENRRHMSFHIGPYMSFLVNASDKHYRFGEISASDFKTFDFGGTAGFRARINRYFLGLDISGGLSEIGKTKMHEGENYNLIGKSRNLALMIYAGVFF